MDEPELEQLPRRGWFRSRSGCVITLLFLTFFGLALAGILTGGYRGLQERALRTQAEVEKHYQQGLEHIKNNRNALAIAELELTLTLDPAHTEAREALQTLRESQQTVPTPTPIPLIEVSRANIAEELFPEARSLALQGNWAESIELLKQIREIDPTFQNKVISDALYTANYELGLRLISERAIVEGIQAFDEALIERPNDPQVTAEWEKATLYLSVEPATDVSSFEDNIVILTRIYNLDPDFIDVSDRLYNTYRDYADHLAEQDDWCLAQPRYQEAAQLKPGSAINRLVTEAEDACEGTQQVATAPTTTPRPTATRRAALAQSSAATPTATPAPTRTAAPDISAGKIYFSRFNEQNRTWEIISVSAQDRSETVVLNNGTQPAISPNGNLLAYHSELNSSVGLHVYNLNTGQDVRATVFAEDLMPRWTGSNIDFVFSSQRSGDRRWQIISGFADGKGEGVVIHDGRTGSASLRDDTVAYQGTDPQGNQPGIYTISANGGEPTRITTGESDRSPALSPTDNRIAFMSTDDGSWGIWTVSASGGTPRQVTTSSANDALPTWSPDGSQIAFVSDRGGSWGIHVVSASGGQPRRVADWGGSHPNWLLEQISWGR